MAAYDTLNDSEHGGEAGNIGTGILALPIAFKRSGLCLGSAFLLFYACLSTYLMHVLLRLSEEVIIKNGLDRSKIDYTEAVFYIVKFGPERFRIYKGKVKHTINVFLLLTQIGFCCIYMLFVAQNTKYFIETTWPGFHANLYLIGFIVAVLLVLLNIKVTMWVFAIPSAIALVATALGLVLIFAYILSTSLEDITSLPAFTSFSEMLVALGIFIFSFEGISLTLPIQNRMRDPKRFVMPSGVLNTTMVINTCLCLTIGFFGYLRFGDAILGSITYNIPNSPPIYAAVKPLFICAIFLSYVLQFYVPATILGRLMLKWRWHREASPRRQSICRKIMRLRGVTILSHLHYAETEMRVVRRSQSDLSSGLVVNLRTLSHPQLMASFCGAYA
ncbi:Proton-coupled amino acid transporter 2 [Taenia solium]|eukprot:TsM_000714400 transcript=TsM_000714400 gene=TsM_000714400